MKLAFSTLGCPDWSFDDIFATAKDLGIKGIEIRGLNDKIYAPKCAVFADDRIESTKAKLSNANMEIPVLDSAAVMGVAEKSEESLKEGYDYIDLAQKLGSRYVRVMPSPYAEVSDCDLELCAENYQKLCEYGAQRGVMPLMETNGILADSKKAVEFMQKIKSDNKGVLWDVNHPYRYFNESPSQTAETLGKYIRHVHIKDSLLTDGKITYKMMGHGDLPLKEFLQSLKSIGYDGYVSLEWLKRWNPDLQEPGIVFAHFVTYTNYLLKQIGA